MEDCFSSRASVLHDAAPRLLGSPDAGRITEIFAEERVRERLTLRVRAGGRSDEQHASSETSGTGVRWVERDAVRSASVDSLDPVEVERALRGLGSGPGEGVPYDVPAPVAHRADQPPADSSSSAACGRPPASSTPVPARDHSPAASAQGAACGHPPAASASGAAYGHPTEWPFGQLDPPPDAPGNASLDEKRFLIRAAAEAAFSLEPHLSHLEVTFVGDVRRKAVWAADIPPAAAATTQVGIRVAARLGDTSVHAVGGGSGGLGTFLLSPPEDLARECIERLHRIRSARTVPGLPDELPVILEAGWGGVWLHEAIGHLLEADTPGPFQTGAVGSRIAPNFVTIVDDGTLRLGRGSARYDDEGTLSGRTVLVREGRLETLLTDRVTANRTGFERTGNARRQDYRFPPMPRMTNLMLEPAATPAADLAADVARGLYVRTVGGGQVRPDEDIFTLDVLDGNLIENGRLTRPVAGLRLSGRPSEMLRRIAGIGDDFRIDPARGTCAKGGQVVPVSVGMPTVLLSRMSVASVT